MICGELCVATSFSDYVISVLNNFCRQLKWGCDGGYNLARQAALLIPPKPKHNGGLEIFESVACGSIVDFFKNFQRAVV